MSRRASAIVLVLALTAVFSGVSHAAEMGLITGMGKGTYYQFGLDLQEVMGQNGIRLNVYPSSGSIENIYAVFNRPGVQLGIVQSDALAFLARVQTNEALRHIAGKIKLVFPLYNEEIHILARKGISGFDGLANRRVAVGREGSGTYLTARLLFEVAQIKPDEMINIGTDEALAALKAGKIDAMFYVAGAPVKLFTENVTEGDGLELLPVTNAQVTEFYPKAEIPANTYAWQTRAVPTVAVKACLISYYFKTSNCENVGRFARILFDNLDQLVQNGHPKWKTVDLDYRLKGWEQYDCVKRSLGPHPGKSAKVNPVLDAIKDMLE